MGTLALFAEAEAPAMRYFSIFPAMAAFRIGCARYLVHSGGVMAGGGEAIWHVIIDDRQEGPLTAAEIHEYHPAGRLSGSDLIWRPGLSDWKEVSELDEFRQPPKRAPLREPARAGTPPAPAEIRSQPDRDEPSAGGKWSLWRSANIGLLFSALTLVIQIAGGRGFVLANYAHTASAETISFLVGQIVAAPLIFVFIAFLRNLLNRRRPKSKASVALGAITFVALFLCLSGALFLYGEVFFSRNEIISGEARSTFIADASYPCIQKQRSADPNATQAQIDKYCACVSEKIASSTTYKQLGTAADAAALAKLKQRLEAAGNACR
jgi:hypothetical protein